MQKTEKTKKMTQSELAEKLGMTDRSISNFRKWKNMPDLSLFKPLCDILGITINELMSGEKIANKEYTEKLEENFINTIDYIDKRNIKDNNIKTISLLILAIIGIFLTQFLITDNEIQNYVTVVCMILGVYSIKELFIRYNLVRRIVTIILLGICITVIILNK